MPETLSNILGPELITNGEFTGDASGWDLGTGWAYGTNNLVATNATANLSQSSVAVVDDATYQLTYTLSGYVDGSYRFFIWGDSSTKRAVTTARTANGNYTETFTINVLSAGTAGLLSLQTLVDGSVTIDNISIRQVIGSGEELVTNGDFTGNADGWTLGDGWAYDSNNITNTGGTANAEQTSPKSIASGATYQVTYTISAYTSGTCRVELIGTGKYGFGATRSSIGTFTESVTINTDTTSGSIDTIRINALLAGTFTIDDISVVEVSRPRDVGSGGGWYYRYYNAATKTKKRRRKARR